MPPIARRSLAPVVKKESALARVLVVWPILNVCPGGTGCCVCERRLEVGWRRGDINHIFFAFLEITSSTKQKCVFANAQKEHQQKGKGFYSPLAILNREFLYIEYCVTYNCVNVYTG